MGSGELRLTPSDLETVFGRLGVQLLTDDGRLLDLKFSEKELPPASDAAHVDVSGDLPRSPAEWRAGSAKEPILSGHGAGKSGADDGASPAARRRQDATQSRRGGKTPVPSNLRFVSDHRR